jgi:hypothetical protein
MIGDHFPMGEFTGQELPGTHATNDTVEPSVPLEVLAQEFEDQKREFAEIRLELERMKGRLRKLAKQVEIPMHEDKSLDGIISYLTKEHDGDVHDKGILTVTSKSVFSAEPRNAVTNAVALSAVSWFTSWDEPDQWICWDFHNTPVGLTGYTIWAQWLASWILEGSVDDSENWTEIDRQTENQDFKDGMRRASFAVSRSAEFRRIRLTQTSANHFNPGHFHLDPADVLRNVLFVRAVEFFGTLSP